MKIIRKHFAVTYQIEKRLLDSLAQKIFRYTTADQLSLLALSGAVMTGLSYYYAGIDLRFLYLANLGIFLHWLGDSLDGRVARLRGKSRLKYGHYLDHILDSVSLVIIIFGINYSGLTLQSAWVWVLALFLLIMIHSFLEASVTGEFDLTIERFGPTEARISLILINIIVCTTQNALILMHPFPTTVMDVLGFIAALVLLFNFLKAVLTTILSIGIKG